MKKTPKTVLSPGVTRLLESWNRGEEDALGEIVAVVYDELRDAARFYLSGRRSLTLPPTALINEVYLRLAERKQMRFESRAQFFWFAGRLMRDIIVDRARERLAQKRGAGDSDLTLDRMEGSSKDGSGDVSIPDLPTLIALDEALGKLETLSDRQARIVELRFFVGLKFKEIAEILAVSETTVKRDWGLTKRWLARELGDRGPQHLQEREQ